MIFLFLYPRRWVGYRLVWKGELLNGIKLNNRIVIIPEFPSPLKHCRVKEIWHSKIILRAIGGDIFEYCVGERKTFTEDESKNLTRQLAQALEFIHSKYIVHLDVKPQNILLSKGICFSWMYMHVPSTILKIMRRSQS